jgi:hypothetical protein
MVPRLASFLIPWDGFQYTFKNHYRKWRQKKENPEKSFFPPSSSPACGFLRSKIVT